MGNLSCLPKVSPRGERLTDWLQKHFTKSARKNKVDDIVAVVVKREMKTGEGRYSSPSTKEEKSLTSLVSCSNAFSPTKIVSPVDNVSQAESVSPTLSESLAEYILEAELVSVHYDGPQSIPGRVIRPSPDGEPPQDVPRLGSTCISPPSDNGSEVWSQSPPESASTYHDDTDTESDMDTDSDTDTDSDGDQELDLPENDDDEEIRPLTPLPETGVFPPTNNDREDHNTASLVQRPFLADDISEKCAVLPSITNVRTCEMPVVRHPAGSYLPRMASPLTLASEHLGPETRIKPRAIVQRPKPAVSLLLTRVRMKKMVEEKVKPQLPAIARIKADAGVFPSHLQVHRTLPTQRPASGRSTVMSDPQCGPNKLRVTSPLDVATSKRPLTALPSNSIHTNTVLTTLQRSVHDFRSNVAERASPFLSHQPRVPSDHSVRQILEAALKVSREYRHTARDSSPQPIRASNQTPSNPLWSRHLGDARRFK